MISGYIAGSLDNIAYVRMVVKYNEKFVLCYHKKSKKWDCVGGRVEKGENPLAAAKRELFEETGAVDFDIVPVRDYERFLEDGTFYNNNREYFVNVYKFSDLPDGSEMERIDFLIKFLMISDMKVNVKQGLNISSVSKNTLLLIGSDEYYNKNPHIT